MKSASIICVHLYNDFSGSPLVLSNAIKAFKKQGKEVEIVTSSSAGFLSNLDISKKEIPYAFHPNKWIRLFYFLWNQLQVFFYILRQRPYADTIYINTLLPFGAALAGKFIGKQVIYHIHETSIRPLILKRFLKWVVALTASKVIYVSKYLQQTEPIHPIPYQVIYNALSPAFIEQAVNHSRKTKKDQSPFTILMLCSLKKYKGVDEFVQLATTLPQYTFELVVNANQPEIEAYFQNQQLSANLTIYDRQSNVHPFYQRADVVLNLSHPDRWVETFGMTLLEAMQYGLPVIAPPVGGPTEVVVDGKNGYAIHCQELTKLKSTIQSLAQNPSLYKRLSTAALRHTQLFHPTHFEYTLAKLV